MKVEAEVWADLGIWEILDEHVRHPKAFEEEEIRALVRAAYAKGYVNALGQGSGGETGPPLSILAACQFAETLRLTLP